MPEELLRKAEPQGCAAEPAPASAPRRRLRRPNRPSAGCASGRPCEHAKFGLGVIVAAEGRGADARVQVNFGGSGMKWLALEYAKLTPV